MMRIAMTLMTLLAFQASNQESPDELVRKALEKDAADSIMVHSFNSEKISKTEEVDQHENFKKLLPEDGDKDRIKSSIAKTFLNGRFTYRFVGLVDQNDRVTIAIHFEPRPRTEQPGPQITADMGFLDREIEKGFNEVLNNLSGRLYLDRETLGIARFEASLTRDIGRRIFLVQRADTTYEQMLFQNVWVPKKIVTVTQYEKFWRKHHEKHTTTFKNYQQRPPGN